MVLLGQRQHLLCEPTRRFTSFRTHHKRGSSSSISSHAQAPRLDRFRKQQRGPAAVCCAARQAKAGQISTVLEPVFRENRVAQERRNWTAGCLRAGLIAVTAFVAANAGAQAGAAEVFDLAAVADSVSGAVTEKTAAFIPGLIGDSPLREGIVSGFLLILFSELGDKTFFLALLLALKESKSLVFAGTFGALAVMTVISVALGQVLHQLDELEFANSNIPLDDLLAVALLLFFGVKTILDARTADESAAEEREEAEQEVSKFSSGAAGLVLSTFALVFAAEWGDKSFLATIALAAASSPTGVVIGAIGGHGLATGIAVLGGSYLGKYLDEKVVQYVGGSLFLVFAAATIVDIVRGV